MLCILEFDARTSLHSGCQLLPSTLDIFPPASLTNKIPDEISHKLISFSQNPSSLPEATYARSSPAEPSRLIPAVAFKITSISVK